MTNTTLFRPCASNADPVPGGSFWFDRGPTHQPRYHQGVDIGISTGTPLYASGEGRVRVVTPTGPGTGLSGGGWYVQVDYVVGGKTLLVTTMHHSRIDVVAGQYVTAATQLGLSGGRKGAAGAGDSTGSHVHYQILIDGVFVDPGKYFNFRPTTAGTGDTPIGDDVSFTDPISKSTTPAQNTAADFLIYARQDAGRAASILEGAEAITHSTLPGQNSLVDYLIYTREDVAAMRASLAALSAAVQTLAAPAGVDGEALAALIASKVDAALADNFAAIPAPPTKFVAAQ